MAYTIGELSINISAKANDASKSISRLTTSVKSLKSECENLTGLKNLRTELNAISQIKLDGKVAALANISKAIKDAKKSGVSDNSRNTIIQIPTASEISSAMGGVKAEISNVMDGISQDAAVAKQETLDELKGIPEGVKEGVAKPTAEQIKIVTDSIKNNLIKKTFGSLLHEVGNLSTGIKSKINGIVSRIMRIAGYRLIRSAIAAVTKEFREGLEVAYEWSANAENGFTGTAKAMDSLASTGAQMKNQLGAAFGQLMVSLAPFFNWLKNEVIAASNALTEFFAAFAGETQYMKALPIETKWKDIEDKEKDATKALKDYKQQLLGLDELNILNTPSDKAGAVTKEVSTEPIYELAPVEKSWTAELAVNLKDVLFNWDNLDARSIGLKICAGLGAATGGLIGFAFGGAGGAIVGTIAGLVLGVTVGSILFDTSKAKYTPETAKMDIINTVFGSTAGAAIGFAVGGPLGAAIGLALGTGITLLVNELSTTYEERIFEDYQNTDFWTKYREFMDVTLPEQLAKDEEITARIKGITLDLNDTEVTNLEVARDLIIEIFDMDAIENKTPEQIAELKTKIETLNGMNLDGVRIEFDELTGAVTTSKDELLAHVDAMISNAKVQAGMEKYIELLKIAKDAELEKIKRDKKLKELQGTQKEAYDKLADAQSRYNLFTNDIAAATELAQQKYGLYNAELVLGEDTYKTLCEEQEKARKDIDLYTLAVNDATEAVNSEQDEIQKMIDKKDEAVENANIMLGLVNDEKAAINKETKAYQKNEAAIGELESAMTDAETELADLEKQTGVTTDSFKDLKTATNNVVKASPKLQEAMNKCKGVFNDVKSAIAGTISELGKLDEAGKTKRTIELEYAVGANMSDAAMLAMYKGVTGKTFASGGFPEGGHLFFANENGNPEYIGNMGGRTAVANSDQMSAAIEAASYAGMSRALAENNKNPMENWQPMSAEEMYLLLRSKSNQNGLRTGVGYAF